MAMNRKDIKIKFDDSKMNYVNYFFVSNYYLNNFSIGFLCLCLFTAHPSSWPPSPQALHLVFKLSNTCRGFRSRQLVELESVVRA